MKLLSLFTGIGAFEKALKNIGINYELINYCEIDKYASKSYSLIHNENEDKNLWDITKIDIGKLPKNIDLITHGSPCQSFSLAGNQEGGDENSKTRSSLMWNSVEIIKHCKPKYVIWENVKNVLSKKHIHNFEKYLSNLENLGYTNYYKVLNAKDFGIPQNRERIFVISILGEHNKFEFPETKELKMHLKDLLEEDNQDLQKYYLKNIKSFFINNSFKMEEQGNGFRFAPHIKENANISSTITTKAGARMDDNYILEDYKSSQNKLIFSMKNKEILDIPNLTELKIRKLTPKECFRLMGFDDTDINICMKNKISNTQLYKQAGNSIVVPVLESIFQNLFK